MPPEPSSARIRYRAMTWPIMSWTYGPNGGLFALEIESELPRHRSTEQVTKHMVLDGLVQEVVHLYGRGRLAASPLHAETPVHQRIGISKAMEGRRQHVAPESAVAVVDHERPEEAGSSVHPSEIEPVGRGK